MIHLSQQQATEATIPITNLGGRKRKPDKKHKKNGRILERQWGGEVSIEMKDGTSVIVRVECTHDEEDGFCKHKIWHYNNAQSSTAVTGCKTVNR